MWVNNTNKEYHIWPHRIYLQNAYKTKSCFSAIRLVDWTGNVAMLHSETKSGFNFYGMDFYEAGKILYMELDFSRNIQPETVPLFHTTIKGSWKPKRLKSTSLLDAERCCIAHTEKVILSFLECWSCQTFTRTRVGTKGVLTRSCQ